MYHAVWKLTALAVVVAVGVVVVIQAQRGMQEQNPAADPEATASLGEEAAGGETQDLLDEIEPPSQAEPEMADDGGGDFVPVAARSGRSRSALQTVGTGASTISMNDAGGDANPGGKISAPAQKKSSVDSDPFADLEEADAPSERQPRADLKSSDVPAGKKPAADLSEMEDNDEPAVDAEEQNAPATTEKTTPPKTRGPVLTLDELDADDDSENDSAAAKRPDRAGAELRVLGATRESPAAKAARSVQSDPFADDDAAPPSSPPPKGGRTPVAADDDEEILKDDESPPAPLPKAALNSKSKPVADDPFKDEEESEEPLALPADKGADSPSRRKPAAPVELKKEVDEDDWEPERRREVKPLLPKSAQESAPAEIESPPPKRTGNPALPQLDEPIPDEPVETVKPELPQMTIDKIAPPKAILGRPMVYQIVVRNTGDVPAHQVVVEDTVPGGVKIDGSIPRAELKENRLIWKLGTLAAGREKKIAVRVVPENEGTIGGVATLNFSPLPPPSANPAAPQLRFQVDAPRKAAVGMPVEFNFRVKNVGSVPATRVTIRDVLPAGLKHGDGDDLEYEIGKIAPGKTNEVKLVLTAAQPGPTVNRVVVTADGNVSESAEVQLEVVGPALTILRGGPRHLFPEKTGRFTNTVTNPGAGPVPKVKLVEVVPAGLEFVNASDGGTYNAARRTVTWSLERLDAGESKTVKISLRATARGAQISVVRAHDREGTSAETIGTTQVAGVPALKIDVGELPALVEVGEIVKIQVRIVNNGSDAASGVRATVPVPAGLKFLSARGPVEHRVAPAAGEAAAPSATEVQFAPIANIDAKGEAAFELTFKGRAPGGTHLEVHAQCDQMNEPVGVKQPLTVALPE
jgi:uncharacterized repeat protein (TIGR01451 family)